LAFRLLHLGRIPVGDYAPAGWEEGSMHDNVGDQGEKFTSARKAVMHDLFGEQENEAEAVDAERSGRTNTARDDAGRAGRTPGRWDSIGEGGEGLDELQGLYAADAAARDYLAEQRPEADSDTTRPPSPVATGITQTLWDRLNALSGETVETPKGEPFALKDVSRGEHVTVSPLDGGQEWQVPAQELEAAWEVVRSGAELDRLASIRLQEAGLASAHPEYIAGLLRAITSDEL
jgi:hypothetical protein